MRIASCGNERRRASGECGKCGYFRNPRHNPLVFALCWLSTLIRSNGMQAALACVRSIPHSKFGSFRLHAPSPVSRGVANLQIGLQVAWSMCRLRSAVSLSRTLKREMAVLRMRSRMPMASRKHAGGMRSPWSGRRRQHPGPSGEWGTQGRGAFVCRKRKRVGPYASVTVPFSSTKYAPSIAGWLLANAMPRSMPSATSVVE